MSGGSAETGDVNADDHASLLVVSHEGISLIVGCVAAGHVMDFLQSCSWKTHNFPIGSKLLKKSSLRHPFTLVGHALCEFTNAAASP